MKRVRDVMGLTNVEVMILSAYTLGESGAGGWDTG